MIMKIRIIFTMMIIFIRRMLPSTHLSWRFLRCPARVNVAVLQVNMMLVLMLLMLMMIIIIIIVLSWS